jgi:hemerythrin
MILWRDELSVGVEQIDAQHKELLQQFDQLLSACRQGKGSEEVLHLLDFLDEYVITHFHDEEQLQKQSGFPDFDEHHREHQAFVAKLEELKNRMHNDGSVLLDHVLDANKMLLDWLIRHISVRDRAVGKHLKDLSMV